MKSKVVRAIGLRVHRRPLLASPSWGAVQPAAAQAEPELGNAGAKSIGSRSSATAGTHGPAPSMRGYGAYSGELDIKDSGIWGIEADITVRPGAQLVLLYSRQDSEITFGYRDDEIIAGNVAVEHWQIGGMSGVQKGKVMPFGMFTLGGTRIVPEWTGAILRRRVEVLDHLRAWRQDLHQREDRSPGSGTDALDLRRGRRVHGLRRGRLLHVFRRIGNGAGGCLRRSFRDVLRGSRPPVCPGFFGAGGAPGATRVLLGRASAW